MFKRSITRLIRAFKMTYKTIGDTSFLIYKGRYYPLSFKIREGENIRLRKVAENIKHHKDTKPYMIFEQ